MKKIGKSLRFFVQVVLLIFMVFLVNLDTGVYSSFVTSNVTNRVVNLDLMALKLEETVKNDLYSVKMTLNGDITGYGADCPMCSGTLSCMPSFYIKDGTTFFPDNDYGDVRIVASSSNLPCGSIVRFDLKSISSDPVIAIVLDRGVGGNNLDLLVESNDMAFTLVGRNNRTYDVLRNGWS